MKLLRDNAIDGGWKVVGSDSTACITGNIGGVICLLEKSLGRRLMWSICLLHTNELPLRHLFTDLDGPTTHANDNMYVNTLQKCLLSSRPASLNTLTDSEK